MTFTELIGGIMGIGSMILIGYAIIVWKSDTALGLAGGVLVASQGFFLRGKVIAPSEQEKDRL